MAESQSREDTIIKSFPYSTLFVVAALYFKDRARLNMSVSTSLRSLLDVDLEILTNFDLSQQLFDKSNWTTYTLTSTQIHTALFANAVIIGVLWILIQFLYGEKKTYSADEEEDKKLRKKARRRLSWVPTFVNSLFMTLMGTGYFVIKTDCLKDVTGIWMYAQGDGEHVWRSMDNVSVLVMAWFAMFNVFDISFGCMYCFECLDPLTAWVHHPVFTWICYVGITGDGILYQGKPFPSSFMVVCMEEFPTWHLAAGAMFPSLRNDWVFGGSFFLLRVCFHLYHAVLCFLNDPSPAWYSVTTPKMIFLFSMLMHLVWFRAWVLKYMIPLLFGKKEKKA